MFLIVSGNHLNGITVNKWTWWILIISEKNRIICNFFVFNKSVNLKSVNGFWSIFSGRIKDSDPDVHNICKMNITGLGWCTTAWCSRGYAA